MFYAHMKFNIIKLGLEYLFFKFQTISLFILLEMF